MFDYNEKNIEEKVEYVKRIKSLLKEGDIVYYLKKNGTKYTIKFGEVVDFYSDAVVVQNYTFCDRRLINGIPANQFETPTKWKKLPKGWTHETQLFTLSYDTEKFSEEKYGTFKVDCKDNIKHWIELGALTKIQDNDFCTFEAEITKDGYRIVRKYREISHYPSNFSYVPYNEVFSDYKDAEKVIKEYEDELIRQSNLSDEEWSIEQIDKELDRWASWYKIPKDTKEKYRTFLLSLEHIENVVVRMFSGQIQWKYNKNSRWITVELD